MGLSIRGFRPGRKIFLYTEYYEVVMGDICWCSLPLAGYATERQISIAPCKMVCWLVGNGRKLYCKYYNMIRIVFYCIVHHANTGL